MVDLFFSESGPKPTQPDHEIDDFDPRASDYAPIQDALDGDSFSSNQNDSNGGFADFSSAFEAQESNVKQEVGEDLFGGFNTTQPSSAELDLFSGVDLPAPVPSLPVQPLAQTFSSVPTQANPTNPASSMDLLGGLDFATPSFPPMGAPQLMGVSQPVMSGQFMGQPAMGQSVMGMPGFGMMQMSGVGPSSLPLQPASSALSAPKQPNGQQMNGNSVHVGSTWQDLGKTGQLFGIKN